MTGAGGAASTGRRGANPLGKARRRRGLVGNGGASAPRPARFPPGRYRVFLGALAVLAFALVLARGATYGPGLDNDPVTYIRVADNLLAGEGFTTWDSRRGFRPYVAWPPLYPVLLAAADLPGLELLSRIHWLNAAFFALAVLVVGAYARRCLASPFLRAWTPVAAALSLPFARWAWYGGSEAPFVLFTLLALISLGRFLEEGKRASLRSSAVFAGLAFGTRYMGVVLIAFAGMLLIRRRWGGLRTAAAYTAVAGLPMVVWLARNHLVSGTLTGVSSAPDYDAAETWSHIGSAVLAWVRFDAGSVPLLVLGALIPPAALLLSTRTATSRGCAPSSPAGRTRWILLFGGFSLSFIGLYFVALMLGEAESGVEPRHLFPARLPLVLALATALDPLLEAGNGRRLLERVGGVVAAVLLSVWAAGQVGLQRRAIGQANSPEVLFDNGFYGEPWASSETMRFLRADASGGSPRIYTNLRSPVFAWVGGRPDIRPVQSWVGGVEAPGGEFTTPQEQLAILVERAPEGARVVWSTDFRRPYHRDAPPAALFAAPGLRPLAEFDDGAVFAVDRGYAPPSDRFREAYESLRTKEPDAEADFEVYFDRGSGAAAGGPTLFYRRTSCREESLRERFFLHVVPRARKALPAEAALYGFENLDFDFLRSGVRWELADGTSACLATVRLPTYGIARVRTGQHRSGDPIWSAEIRFR